MTTKKRGLEYGVFVLVRESLINHSDEYGGTLIVAGSLKDK